MRTVFDILLIFSLIFAMMCIASKYIDEKSFNNGYCKRCKHRLTFIGRDSGGSRGYLCECCEYVTWVDFKSTDRDFRREEVMRRVRKGEVRHNE